MDERLVILAVAANMRRVAEWGIEDDPRHDLIVKFLDQSVYLASSVDTARFNSKESSWLSKFLEDIPLLQQELNQGVLDKYIWAEKILTWGNILIRLG